MLHKIHVCLLNTVTTLKVKHHLSILYSFAKSVSIALTLNALLVFLKVEEYRAVTRSQRLTLPFTANHLQVTLTALEIMSTKNI